jgi:uncharacterized protein DUF1566
MQTLDSELRGVIESRLRSANPREVLAIASALCAQELQVPGSVHARGPQPPAALGPRFVVRDDIVQDSTTGLMWTRKNVHSSRLNWSGAKEACSKARDGGFDDWRLPTIQELLTLVDYSRTSPAIDISVFECESSWYWSATPYSASPGDYAWCVYFGYGYSLYSYQDYEGCVRAVRSGQIIGHLA